jgi:small subunit ribosomal protein S5
MDFDGKGEEIVEKVVFINRSSKVVKGGRRFSFSALVVVGDKKGRVGYALGKAAEVADAIRRAGELARRQMTSVSLKDATIPHEIYSEYDGARILLRPASPGTGVIAGKTVRAVLESVGVRDVLTKSLGSSNAANVVKATLNGLLRLRSREDIYRRRGLEIKKVPFRPRTNFLCDYTILNLGPAPSIGANVSARANPAGVAKPPVAVARARPRAPAVPSGSALKAARCR